MGSVPSSRLTKILQEKAELLRKRRQTADQAQKALDEQLALLEEVGVTLSESAERTAKLQEASRKSDWEAVEALAKDFVSYLARSVAPALDARRREIVPRAEALLKAGASLPDDLPQIIGEVNQFQFDHDWTAGVGRLVRLDRIAREAQSELSARLRARARAVAEWAGEPADRIPALEEKVAEALKPIQEGKVVEAMERLGRAFPPLAPRAVEREQSARRAGEAILAAARDLGAPYAPLEVALRKDAEGLPIDWKETVPEVESASAQVGEELRGRVAAAIQSLRGTLDSLRESGTDPSENLERLAQTLAEVPSASPADLPKLLNDARQATEEPVVAVVASLLDEVRPRLVEARRLGRDASEVFAAMNRAREALRLKIYSEALAASQEALDRVSQLTQDLDGARDEWESLRDLLGRLAAVRFPTEAYAAALERAHEELERTQVARAQEMMRETVRTLGRDALAHFSGQADRFQKVFDHARERGFLPDGAEGELEAIRQQLKDGLLADAGESLAKLDVRMRTAAGPYVARRVEEIEKGFEEIPDESLVAPARRLLADADVNLRVKEDLLAALEALRRAEREFAAVFAAHASSLVEALEVERKTLEAMGGAGDEIQRQIDEVQQIFNMGDFVKASRASQEIRTRALQQQLVRSEEATSHAKLALVEVGKMGVDTAALKTRQEAALVAARDRKYAEAYRIATEVEDAALDLRENAQKVVDALARATELWQTLKDGGVTVEPYRERIRDAKQAYQALDFGKATETLDQLTALLVEERARFETKRFVAEGELLLEDARRLGVPAESAQGALTEARGLLESGAPTEALERATAAHQGLVRQLRPVLEENVRSVEQDLEVATAAGLDAPKVVEELGEARRRLALAVPTGVAERVEAARSELIETRGFLEHAELAVSRLRSAFAEAELVRSATAAQRTRLEAVEGRLDQRDYARAVELSGKLEADVRQGTRQHVAKSLASFQGMLVAARQEGSETAVAENLLSQARQALEEGKPIEALQLASRSEAEIERAELQARIARGSLETIEARVREVTAEGVRSARAQEGLERAQAAYKRHDYVTVLERAVEATDELASARAGHHRAREALDSADRQVKEALELGADTQEVVKVLEVARGQFSGGEYADATRRSREAAEMSRWAVERLHAGLVAEVRGLLDTMHELGAAREDARAARELEQGDAGLKARDWRNAREHLERARHLAVEALDGFLNARHAELDGLYASIPESPPELQFREQAKVRFEAERERHEFAQAFQVLKEEEARARGVQRGGLEREVAELKERLWVGEKLGLDTTPVMEIFSEAKSAIDQGNLAQVAPLVTKGNATLAGLIEERLALRLHDVETELAFARDGLRVTLGSLPERVTAVGTLQSEGRLVDAARTLLAAEEELNQRKSLHRELLNIHYLIDAALARAGERHLDASEARKLLDESIRARGDDYAVALEKAREALRLLQKLTKPPETPTPTTFWPFRRSQSP